jgi:hypothetical protein
MNRLVYWLLAALACLVMSYQHPSEWESAQQVEDDKLQAQTDARVAAIGEQR